MGGSGHVVHANWQNTSADDIALNISVKAIRVNVVNEYYQFRVCIYTSSTSDEGIVLDSVATSSSSYTTHNFCVTVPAGKVLTIWNNNDVKTIWTITYK